MAFVKSDLAQQFSVPLDYARQAPDPDGPYEGRSSLREVTREEFDAYRQARPDGHWSIKTPVGVAGPERYFILPDEALS